MNKIISFIFLAVLVSSSAYAWLPVSSYCQISPASASCSVYNPYPQVIYCQGQAQGLTFSGFSVWGAFNAPIFPGAYAYANVYALNPWNDPLISANANFWCNY
jgi:hypothetical protein